MNLAEFKEYCLRKKGTSFYFPFDENTLVMRVGSKMFALTNINSDEFKINLKCDPFMAMDLRNDYEDIEAAYHMNKKHWNTVRVNGALDEAMVRMLIDISYDLVFKGLKKSEREGIS